MKTRSSLAFVCTLVMCMSAAASAPPTRYTIGNTGISQDIAADNQTGLTWQRSFQDQVTYAEADSFCQSLVLGGASDWRLPSIRELVSIVDHTRVVPAIDEATFPGTPSLYFWSSTPYVDTPGTMWTIYFGNGGMTGYGGSQKLHVRCVR